MSPEKSIRQIVEEWNAEAEAEGRLLKEHFWEIPPSPGSIFDVPVTPEAAARIKRLDAHIAQRKRERAMAITAGMQDVHGRIEDAIPLDSMPAEAEA